MSLKLNVSPQQHSMDLHINAQVARTTNWGDITGTLSNQTDLQQALNSKVDKVEGKGLSTNDYTNGEKLKLAGIQNGAEVNVQSDWNQTDSTSDDFIKNKPYIPLKTSDLQNDSGFITNAVDNLINYSTTSQMNTAINNHHDSTKQDTLTQAQLDAVNSGITAERVASYNEKVKVVRNASECLVFYKETIQ